MLWRAQVPGPAAQEGLGFPGRSGGGAPRAAPYCPSTSWPAFPGLERLLARCGTYRGFQELPTSIQAALILLSHRQHTAEPQIQDSLTLSSSQNKNKGFPLPAPRRISLAHSRQAPKCCPAPWISPAPPPAGQGALAMSSGHQHSTAPHPLLTSHLIKGRNNTLGLSAAHSAPAQTLPGRAAPPGRGDEAQMPH